MSITTKSLANLTAWFQNQGDRVAFSDSSGWVEFARGVFQAFPYHWVVTPSEDELADVIRSHKMLALRYSAPITSRSGQISYHIVYEKASYPLSCLHKKVRHDIASGLEHAAYEPISARRLAVDGWDLQHDTLVRQRRENAQTKECWERICLSAEGIPGFQPWGALHNGELVGALLSFTQEDTVSIFFQQSKTEHMKFGVNNALTYVFTQEVLHNPEVRCIFYGLNSLDAPATVDQFKIRMGYMAKAVRQRVVFNPILKPFINSLSHGLLRGIKKVYPKNCAVSKAEGMLRFCLQGRLALSEQKWPELLEEQKNRILYPGTVQ